MRTRVAFVLGFVALLMSGGVTAGQASQGPSRYWDVAGVVGQSQSDSTLGHVGTTSVGIAGIGFNQTEYTGYQGRPHLKETSVDLVVARVGQSTAEPDWSGDSYRSTGIGVVAVAVSQDQNLDDGTCAFNVTVITTNVASVPCPTGTAVQEVPMIPYMPPDGTEHVCNGQGQCT